MDDALTLDVDAGLASAQGKPRGTRKAAAPTKKKPLTDEQRTMHSVKRKGWKHVQEHKLESTSVATLAAAA